MSRCDIRTMRRQEIDKRTMSAVMQQLRVGVSESARCARLQPGNQGRLEGMEAQVLGHTYRMLEKTACSRNRPERSGMTLEATRSLTPFLEVV